LQPSCVFHNLPFHHHPPLQNRAKSNGHSVEQDQLLISVAGFGAERSASFIQIAFQVIKRSRLALEI